MSFTPRPLLLCGLLCSTLALCACKSKPAKEQSVPSASASAAAAPVSSAIDPNYPPPPDWQNPPAQAQRSESGLISLQLAAGQGAQRLTENDLVDIRYTVWKGDGAVFSTTGDGHQRVDLNKQIAGLREALLQMAVGEKRRLWIPFKLAFGSLPKIHNAPQTDLIYNVELVRIVPRPALPPDAATPPKDAKFTKSGLAYKVLEPGTGSEHPGPKARIEMSYSTFQPDGTLYMSTLTRYDSETAQMRMLPAGMFEGAQLMVEGELTRFWIPGKLAYGEERPGAPAAPFEPPRGPLVVDMRVIKIITQDAAKADAERRAAKAAQQAEEAASGAGAGAK